MGLYTIYPNAVVHLPRFCIYRFSFLKAVRLAAADFVPYEVIPCVDFSASLKQSLSDPDRRKDRRPFLPQLHCDRCDLCDEFFSCHRFFPPFPFTAEMTFASGPSGTPSFRDLMTELTDRLSGAKRGIYLSLAVPASASPYDAMPKFSTLPRPTSLFSKETAPVFPATLLTGANLSIACLVRSGVI